MKSFSEKQKSTPGISTRADPSSEPPTPGVFTSTADLLLSLNPTIQMTSARDSKLTSILGKYGSHAHFLYPYMSRSFLLHFFYDWYSSSLILTSYYLFTFHISLFRSLHPYFLIELYHIYFLSLYLITTCSVLVFSFFSFRNFLLYSNHFSSFFGSFSSLSPFSLPLSSSFISSCNTRQLPHSIPRLLKRWRKPLQAD